MARRWLDRPNPVGRRHRTREGGIGELVGALGSDLGELGSENLTGAGTP
jgi:hypothetical protein